MYRADHNRHLICKLGVHSTDSLSISRLGTGEMNQTILTGHPGDGVSCLAFSPSSSSELLVSSWDSTVRLYDPLQNFSKATYNFSGACLTCCFNKNNGSSGFCGGLDAQVSALDLSRGTASARTGLGQHRKAVSCLDYAAEDNILVSGSWDSSVSFWDPRGATGSSGSSLIQNIATPGKVYSISVTGQRVVVATSERHILVYDVRNLNQVVQERESPLRHQTRKVACSIDGRFFAVGSTEGRVAIEYFDSDPEVQARKYAFKCHRVQRNAYPVNAIAFHPEYGTFATGGSDGAVNVWDGENKKRLAQLPAYPNSISSLAFNYNGTVLAIASSYIFDEGKMNDPTSLEQDNVYLRFVDDAEVRPRVKA